MQHSRRAGDTSSSLLRCWGWAASLSLAACGGAATQDDGLEASPSEPDPGAANQPGNSVPSEARPPVEPITAPCPTALGSSDELLSTPRADSNLELLALELEPGRLTASQGTYDRVVADLAAMRARSPSLADIYFSPPHDGRTLDIELTEDAILAVAAGLYPAWDCLNEAYGAELLFPIDFFGGFVFQIRLRGIYDLPRIAEQYRQLPGVLSVSTSTSGGAPPPLCAARDGNIYEYVVDRASAGCESTSTCNQHRARHYVSDAPGQVTALEVWDSESGAPAPEWYVALCR